MSHYLTRYNSPDRKANDIKAINDIMDYLSSKQWTMMMEAVATRPVDFAQINFFLAFTGIEGYPVHAFGRTYCIDAYRAWMLSDAQGVSIQTDEDGFPIVE